MEFSLPTQTEVLRSHVRRWAREREQWRAGDAPFDPIHWRETVDLGIIGAESAGGDAVDVAVGFMEVAHVGMPGPLLESYVAVASGSSEARAALDAGKVVTSWCSDDKDSGAIVGWGGVADLVVHAGSGATIHHGALPRVPYEYGFPHGWLDRGVRTDRELLPDSVRNRRWIAASALVCGLGDAALEQASAHAKVRRQFGNPIGAFQAVQRRLVNCAVWLKGCRLAVLDAAWRISEERQGADIAAALSWVVSAKVAQIVEKECHQVLGATGFTRETGLVGLTWPLWWLRATVDSLQAEAYVADNARHIPNGVTNVFELFTDFSG